MIVELSKFVILTLMVVYTFHCFYMVKQQSEEERNESLRQQLMLIFFMDFTAFLVIYLKTGKFQVVTFYAEMMAFFAGIQILYRMLYKKASILLLNNMCMLLSVGFIILCRLDVATATRQLIIVAAVNLVALAVPVLIRKMKFLKDLTWLYAGVGILLLGAVLVIARTSYGAKLSLMGIMPSEAIKITFVFFMAALLRRGADFRTVVQATIVAGLHVGILVLSRDLGSAVIFFAAYLVMVYVATKNVGYLALGLGGGAAGSVIAYHLFGHVRQRVSAWKDPMAVYQNEGYQIVQSLFAIGTGGWFGMGLCQGSPEKIPVVKNDFIFSAICEELGGILQSADSVSRVLPHDCKLHAVSSILFITDCAGTWYGICISGFPYNRWCNQIYPYDRCNTPSCKLRRKFIIMYDPDACNHSGTFYILREDEDDEFEKRRQEAIQRIREREEIGRTQPDLKTRSQKSKLHL